MQKYFDIKRIIGGVSFLILLILVLNSWATINSGQVGIVSTFGRLSEDLLEPGVHFVLPYKSVHRINLQIRTVEVNSEAASKDLQTVHTSIVLNYYLKRENSISLFQKISPDVDYIEKSVVAPFVNESFKAVVAHYTAEDLVNKRDIVSKDIEVFLNDKLQHDFLNVNSISVTNFKFSDSFNQAIESKVTAQQQVLTAQNNFSRQKIENDIKISKAQAEAQALNLQKQAVTDELLKLREIENTSKAIEKWDGKLPQYTGSNIPFVKTIN